MQQTKDIFADKALYPHKGSILDHFSGPYDAACVVLMPFVGDGWSDPAIDITEQSYPDDELIYKKSRPIRWKSIIDNTDIRDYTELNRALRTSIGALRPMFRRPELAEELDRYTTGKRIWYPTEGMFDIFSKVSIYRVLAMLRIKDVTLTDEFYERSTTLDISRVTEWEFSESVDDDHRYIYAADRKVLFTIEWDSFFFIVASDTETLRRIWDAGIFEGFHCDETTSHHWDYSPGELERLIELEKRMNGESKEER